MIAFPSKIRTIFVWILPRVMFIFLGLLSPIPALYAYSPVPSCEALFTGAGDLLGPKRAEFQSDTDIVFRPGDLRSQDLGGVSTFYMTSLMEYAHLVWQIVGKTMPGKLYAILDRIDSTTTNQTAKNVTNIIFYDLKVQPVDRAVRTSGGIKASLVIEMRKRELLMETWRGPMATAEPARVLLQFEIGAKYGPEMTLVIADRIHSGLLVITDGSNAIGPWAIFGGRKIVIEILPTVSEATFRAILSAIAQQSL